MRFSLFFILCPDRRFLSFEYPIAANGPAQS